MRVVAISYFFVLMTTAIAEEGWQGDGEIGYVSSSGRSNGETLTADTKLNYSAPPWDSEFSAKIRRSKNKQSTVADLQEYRTQTSWRFGESSLWFGAVRYQRDAFSTYQYQAAAAAGYGYRFWDDDNGKLIAAIGLGQRQNKSALDGGHDRELIYFSKISHQQQLNALSKWATVFLLEHGDPNRFWEFETGITFEVSDNFKLKVSHEIRHSKEDNSPEQPNDYMTSTSIVFSF